jgi:DNA-binding winged helix-turn-helix (wHTH) protein/Tfp pilus assembly protein PilF
LDVPPKALSLLRVLLEEAGALVRTEEIIDALWPESDVGLANVTQYVSLLRRALDDDPRDPRFIASHYGRGYRFVAPVRRVRRGTASAGGSSASAAHLREARYLLERRRPADVRAAARLFGAALRADPRDVAARSGLAEASSTLGSYLVEDPTWAFARARRHAETSLRLDAEAARAYAVLGHIALFHDRDFEAVQKHCDSALVLDQDDGLAIRVLGRLAMVTGDLDGARSLIERELELRPASLDALTMLGVVEQYRRRPADAAELLRRVCELDRTAMLPRYHLATCLVDAGDCLEAVQMLRALATREATPAVLAALARAHALAGSTGDARRILAALADTGRRVFVSPYVLAGVHLALGNGAATKASLREARERRDPWFIFLAVEPRFDAMRL